MPISNLKPSVVSLSAFVRGTANEKLKGPMGVNQSTAKPVADLILLLSSSAIRECPRVYQIVLQKS